MRTHIQKLSVIADKLRERGEVLPEIQLVTKGLASLWVLYLNITTLSLLNMTFFLSLSIFSGQKITELSDQSGQLCQWQTERWTISYSDYWQKKLWSNHTRRMMLLLRPHSLAAAGQKVVIRTAPEATLAQGAEAAEANHSVLKEDS